MAKADSILDEGAQNDILGQQTGVSLLKNLNKFLTLKNISFLQMFNRTFFLNGYLNK